MKLALFLLLFLPFITSASVVINEIAWMGTLPKDGESAQAAANNEWVELYNSSADAISLEGWILTSSDLRPNITLSGSIPAGGYYLMERTSDEVVPGIAAELIYPYKDNALSNTGEYLFLKDASGNVVDDVSASSGWPAGDNNTKETMQRSGTTWVTAAATPKAANSGSASQPPAPDLEPPPPAPEPEPSPSPLPPPPPPPPSATNSEPSSSDPPLAPPPPPIPASTPPPASITESESSLTDNVSGNTEISPPAVEPAAQTAKENNVNIIDNNEESFHKTPLNIEIENSKRARERKYGSPNPIDLTPIDSEVAQTALLSESLPETQNSIFS